MKAVGTSYMLATSGADYAAARRFLREHEVACEGLSFPTVIARREGKVIGVVGTRPQKKALICGPVFIHVPGNPAFVALRMLQAYEAILRSAGATFYIFAIGADNPEWMRSVQRALGAEPFTKDEQHRLWFRRNIA